MIRAALLALAVLGCSFEAPPLDAPAGALGVCLWKPTPLAIDALPPSPQGCWEQHAPEHAALTSFELADPCDAPAVGVSAIVLTPGVKAYGYFYAGPPLGERSFWVESVECPE